MNIKNIDNYKVYSQSKVKLTRTGNISNIVCLSRQLDFECPIKKISNEEYVKIDTGEICNFKHLNNRSEDLDTIRMSISRLRNLINNNFVGGLNELWITLTFGENKIYNPNELCPIFEKFIKRLRTHYKHLNLDYIYVPEPHEKGDWHIHLLLKADKPLYIENKELNQVWGHGFVKVNRLLDIDNIGAYVSAYLINIKDGEITKKGARLCLYPPKHNLYRCSRGIKPPISEFMTYEQAINSIGSSSLTYINTVSVEADTGFNYTVHKEYYNKKRGVTDV